MSPIIVRYTVKPDLAETNAELVRAVYEDLPAWASRAPIPVFARACEARPGGHIAAIGDTRSALPARVSAHR